MLCRTCRKRFEATENGVCPWCGERNPSAGVLKTSTILISAANTEGVYRSVKDVPAPLRKKLLKSTNGLNSATILIADRRGREELARAIRKLPTSIQRRLFLSLFDGEEPAAGFPRLRRSLSMLLVLATALFVWLVFSRHWF